MRSLARSTRARMAALLLVAAAFAATPAHATTVSMGGTITDSVTGEPVSGVCVLVWKEEDDGMSAWEQYPHECTGDNGVWSKAGLEPGVYYVEAAGAGYVKQYAYGQDHSWGAERFSLGEGDSQTVDLVMELGGTIEGTITETATGLPINGACVSTQGEGTFASTCTNEDGTYALGGLRAGSQYVLYFSDDAGRYTSELAHDTASDDFDNATRFTVVAGETTTVNESLDAAASITGTVTDAASGDPMAGVCVNALSEPEGFESVGFACTDVDGNYRMAPVPAGAHHLSVEDDAGAHPRTWHPSTTVPAESVPVTVVAGRETTGGDIAMPAAGYISGTVTLASTGEPLAGVCTVGVRASDDRALRGAGPASCSDENGHYTLGGLPTGDAKVIFYPPSDELLMQWAYGADNAADAAHIAVATGQTTTGVDVAMVAGGRITGRITDSKTKKPIEGACATVGVHSHRSGENGTQWPSVCSGADGRYEMRGLPTGEYTLQFYAPEGEWASQFFPNKPDRVNAAKLQVTAGTVLEGINGRLVPGGRIEGVVLDPVTGGPADGVCLDAYSARRPDPIGTSYCTGPDGRYVLKGFPTTKVKIQLTHDGRGDWDMSWVHNATSFETATPIPTTAGATTPLNVTAVPRPA